MAFSADGRRLATASADGTAKVWDATTGAELLTLTGHTSIVVGVAFSADGRRLATASWDGTAKVWAHDMGLLIQRARERVTRSLTPEECRVYLHLDVCPDSR